MAKIPVFLVTGFLGSGKTTLIDNMLQAFDKRYRIGIIQNEFAPANVDGAVLKKGGRSFEMLEINNGSIFCICLMGDFTISLATFIKDKHPDLILIETSGLSDPASIMEIVQNPVLSDIISLRESWCVVDARHFLYLENMLNRMRHQMLIADRILINKKDLVAPEVIAGIRDYVRGLNPYAIVAETSYCRIEFNPDTLPGFVPRAMAKENGIGNAEMGRPDIRVGVFKTGRKISLQDLDDLIRHYAASTARIKGNVFLANGHTALVQTVFEEVNVTLAHQPYGNTCLVIMGEKFDLSEFSRKFRTLTNRHEHQNI